MRKWRLTCIYGKITIFLCWYNARQNALKNRFGAINNTRAGGCY